VQALCNELSSYREHPGFAGRELQSIFFGGGTPSLLSPKATAHIIEHAKSIFPLLSDAEVTLEANPSEPSEARYAGYREAGINRLSFGVQSFDAERLALLGRDHSAADAQRAVHAAIAAGITNVSIDIIFGVPGQSVKQVAQDLEITTALPITHISTYALTIEAGTPFFQRQERGLLRLPPEERVAKMLSFIPEQLSKSGFDRYEISNYAKPGHESRHNTAYWLGDDYLGIGAGAHSCVTLRERDHKISAERWSTYALPTSYMERALLGTTVAWRETLDQQGLQFEFLYLGLRRMQGVSRHRYKQFFGMELPTRYEETLRELEREGCVTMRGDSIALTTQGIALSDSVFERLA
jgi:oxygen-independent coproporphyrinogen-3 oxidase